MTCNVHNIIDLYVQHYPLSVAWGSQLFLKHWVYDIKKKKKKRKDRLLSDLRVRAFFHKTVRVCQVYCNFKIGFTWSDYRNFWNTERWKSFN